MKKTDRQRPGEKARPCYCFLGAEISRGRMREDASFPVAPTRMGLPTATPIVLAEIKQRIQTERLRTVMAANSAMVMLYWDIGRLILDRQETRRVGRQGH